MVISPLWYLSAVAAFDYAAGRSLWEQAPILKHLMLQIICPLQASFALYFFGVLRVFGNNRLVVYPFQCFII